MRKIEEISLIHFQEQNYVHQDDHIFFVNSDECASSIGRIGGEQKLYLASYCIHKHVVIHEVNIFSRVNVKAFVKSFAKICKLVIIILTCIYF